MVTLPKDASPNWVDENIREFMVFDPKLIHQGIEKAIEQQNDPVAIDLINLVTPLNTYTLEYICKNSHSEAVRHAAIQSVIETVTLSSSSNFLASCSVDERISVLDQVVDRTGKKLNTTQFTNIIRDLDENDIIEIFSRRPEAASVQSLIGKFTDSTNEKLTALSEKSVSLIQNSREFQYADYYGIEHIMLRNPEILFSRNIYKVFRPPNTSLAQEVQHWVENARPEIHAQLTPEKLCRILEEYPKTYYNTLGYSEAYTSLAEDGRMDLAKVFIRHLKDSSSTDRMFLRQRLLAASSADEFGGLLFLHNQSPKNAFGSGVRAYAKLVPWIQDLVDFQTKLQQANQRIDVLSLQTMIEALPIRASVLQLAELDMPITDKHVQSLIVESSSKKHRRI